MPTYHRFHRPDRVEQVQSQFQPNPLHEDPSIDLNHLTQVRLFETPPPPLYVAGHKQMHIAVYLIYCCLSVLTAGEETLKVCLYLTTSTPAKWTVGW